MQPLSVTSREMLQCERRYKGFSSQEFFTNITIEHLYRVAYVVLGLRGQLDKSVKLDEFIDGWAVQFRDPVDQARERRAAAGDDEFDDDEVGSEVDPTQMTA
jgi:hypothetical protein